MKRDNIKNLQLNKPGLFTPTVVRGLKQGPPGQSLSFSRRDNEEFADSTLGSTSSFKYNVDGQGLRSTQQLNIDWSQFVNHTFFNSAQVKTNVAFDKIINEFPFDGTKSEFEAFFSSLTGFEKYVYDNFPKNKGYLFFSGTLETEANGGTYVTVKDIAGSAFPSVSRLRTGKSILNPEDKSMTIEMQLWLPPQENSGSVILDKHVDGGATDLQGFYVALEPTGSSASGSVSFFVLSGAIVDKVTVAVDKDQWNHVAWTWNRSPNSGIITGYVNQVVIASSSQPIEFSTLNASTADLIVGSGSAITGQFTPTTTFSGAIDELRIWHTVRTSKQRDLYKEKAIFASTDLKLYFKFNESSGSQSSLVLDHSNNSLHGRLSSNAITFGVREIATSSIAGPSPMIYEKLSSTPVLFPTHEGVSDLQTTFLISASQYDLQNPNIITKLIPSHYFIEGQAQDALSTEAGDIVDELQGGTDPRTVRLGATQTFLLLLYTWAKFFDELKLYVQAFSSLNSVDYDNTDTIPDQFLRFFAANEGIELPPLFDGSSIEQYIDSENIQNNISTNDLSLQYVRNQIWRRILINIRDVVKSKGTIHSVKSFIRSTGIDPDNNFRIREYGGPTQRPLTFARDKRSEISTLLNFVSGGFVQSPFLSSSREEIGFPEPSTLPSDGFLTSGSWTYEALYKFLPSSRISTSQSLARLHGTGSSGVPLFANLVATSGSNAAVTLFTRPAKTGDVFIMAITGVDIFDGNQWYLSFGRQRNDDNLDSIISSSYFLRVARSNFGEIIETYSTSSLFDDGTLSENGFQSVDVDASSGSYIAIGSQSIDLFSGFLNDSSVVTESTARVTNLFGKVGHIRFYSKFLTNDEWPEHVRYFRSVGVFDPTKNFNFTITPTGSWERLRLDVSTDQPVTESNSSGEILLTDFTQNNFIMTGSSFPLTKSVIEPERFFYSSLSPKFDQAATIEKVRIRSFQDFDNVQSLPWASVAPVYDIEKSETPTDNVRFTIDFSVVDALDQDIITIFSSLDTLDNFLGNPELVFSPDYPALEDLRQIYFNKLESKMNLKLFFEFFKWFDTNIATFISQLIPRKTNYLGANFVIESHMLERAKVEYAFSDIYLGDNLRHGLKDTILLRLITGDFKRY